MSVPYNLIDEKWIPVARRSGKVEMIAPAQIADREDPPLRIASPRPDFDGALLEFLIGLLQTAAAPANETIWRREFETPPLVDELNKCLASVREAFFLDGDGPRFMQDLTVADNPAAEEVPIGGLLIDRIGEKGLDESPGLFAKPGLLDALDYPATAAALMTLQSYAPAGGAGHRTSLRGGGPLTTAILGDDLWATIWLNVLPRAEFEHLVPGNATKADLPSRFPWMGPPRTSEKDTGRTTTPQDIHPVQHFWGLPRRFRAVFAQDQEGTCAVNGSAGAVVRSFVGRPSGTNYKGDFRHPLTPYSFNKEGEPWNPKKGGVDGFPYRDWPLVVSGGETRSPPAIVNYFRINRRDLVHNPRVATFGYAMDNMKPLRWVRAETPLITVVPAHATTFAGEVEQLVQASEEIRRTLAYQVKAAWSDRPKELDVLALVNPAFWSATESSFFRTVHAIKQAIEEGSRLVAPKEAWLAELHHAALALFDSLVGAPADLAAPDLGRVVLARKALAQFTNGGARKLRELMNLPVEAIPKTRKAPARKKPTKEPEP